MADDTSDLFQEEMNERQELERLRALVVDLKCAGQAMSEELLYFIEAAKGDNGDPMAFPAAQLSLTT